MLLKSLSQQFHHIYWWMSRQLRWKKSLLLTYQILGLLVNTLAVDGKYSVLNRDNSTIPIQMQLSQKQRKSSLFFLHFWNLDDILKIWNEKMIPIDFAFPKLRTLKTPLGKCLKSPVSENHSTISMVKGSENCWNLHHRTFIIFIDYFEDSWVGKNISYWHAKSWDCFSIYWLPMASILFLIGTN